MRTGTQSAVIHLADAQLRIPGPAGEHSISLLRHGTLEVKLSLPVRPNEQTPHAKDELYIIIRGSGVLSLGGTRRSVEAGDLAFVAAGTEHHFEDFSEDLAVWVISGEWALSLEDSVLSPVVAPSVRSGARRLEHHEPRFASHLMIVFESGPVESRFELLSDGREVAATDDRGQQIVSSLSVCVESTLRDAMFRDYACVLLADCSGAPIGCGLSAGNHEASLRVIQTLPGWVSDSSAFLGRVPV